MDVISPNTRNRVDEQFDKGHHVCVQTHTISSCPPHWHNYFEIEIITAGTGVHILNGTQYIISERSAYLLTPTDFHEVTSSNPLHLVNISFDEEILTEKMLSIIFSAGTGRVYQLDSGTYQRITMAAQLLQYECETDSPCKQQLCEYLVSCLLGGQISSTLDSASPEHLTGIRRAIFYLELHFREPISLSMLAKQSGFTSAYFSSLFRKLTGETYIERLNTLRIGYARTLLVNGLSVSETCFASGFGSLSNFLVTFKRMCHMTPSEYQKEHTKRSNTEISSNALDILQKGC